MSNYTIANWAKENPGRAVLIGAGATWIAAPALVAAPILGLVGFSSQGVVASSFAAAWHSSIGNVVANSLFASLQSAGALGYGVGAVNTLVQAAGAATVLAGAYSPENARE